MLPGKVWKKAREVVLNEWENIRPNIFEAFLKRQIINAECENCGNIAVVRYVYLFYIVCL